MNFTIITTVLNGINTIDGALSSVKKCFPGCQHIVIDAGSTDGTYEFLKNDLYIELVYKPKISIQDAWNFGVSISIGEYIGILNADDRYDSSVGENIISTLQQVPSCEILLGDVVVVSKTGIRRKYNAKKPNKLNLLFGIPFLHPGVFVKKDFYKKIGFFRDDLSVAFDAEWLLRAILISPKFAVYNGSTFMLDGGLSKRKSWIGFGERLQAINDLQMSKVYILSLLFFKFIIQIKNCIR